MNQKGRGIAVLFVAAFVLLCVVGIPAVNWFGWHGSIVAVYFFLVLGLWVLWSRKSLLVVVCVGAVLFYFWRPFSGSASTRSPSSCPHATRTPSALRGPYASIDQLMRCDGVGPDALRLTGSGTAEYGFVILRERRRPAYYATSPVHSSQPANPGCSQRPMVQPEDFITSWLAAINAAHVDKNDYVWAATVHTHPACPMASNSFTATDFNQAIILKNAPATSNPPVELEEIVMINANDHKVRAFAPRSGDQLFTTFGIEASDRFLPYISLGWDKDALRVQIIAAYP